MNTNTLPPFRNWCEDREPNRNRWQKELTKLIVENAEAMASDRLNERDALIHNRPWKPVASSIHVLADRAGTIALQAEYDALKEAAESLFPTAPLTPGWTPSYEDPCNAGLNPVAEPNDGYPSAGLVEMAEARNFVRFLRRTDGRRWVQFMFQTGNGHRLESYQAVGSIVSRIFDEAFAGKPVTVMFITNSPDLWVHFDSPAYKAGLNLGVQEGTALRASSPYLNGLFVETITSDIEPL